LQIFLVHLKGAAADTDIRAVRIEGLHPQRHVWATPVIAIVAVIAPARPFGVGSLSHPANLMSLPIPAIRTPQSSLRPYWAAHSPRGGCSGQIWATDDFIKRR
jgi:hypothetical protein